MQEERLYSILIQLLAQGARIEECQRDGSRYTLIHQGQRQCISGALAQKLQREGHIKSICHVSGKRLWMAIV